MLPQEVVGQCGLAVTHLSSNSEDVGSISGTGRYIVARMTTQNGGPLSLGPIPSGRLKNLNDVDKWSSLSLYLPVRDCQLLVSWGCTCTVGLVK